MAVAPALRGIGISCKHVDEVSLSALPRFPELRQIVSIDIRDDGFSSVGRCEKLESLWCMYCRDTSDAATKSIEKLPQLKTYYAGMTQITDRSLEILSRMHSLESLEFWACQGITDTGVSHLPTLPLLREVAISSSPDVSPNMTTLFPSHVHVKYLG